jgi:hypothetical protein
MGKQRESKISLDIQHMIRERGGFCFKVWGNPMMMAGLPDVICCYRGIFIGFETKVMDENSETSLRQDYVHRKIDESGGLVYVLRCVQDVTEVLDSIDDSFTHNGSVTDVIQR